MNIVQLLLLALLLIFPLGQIGRLSFLNGEVNLLVLDVAVMLTVVAWSVFQKKKERTGSLTKPLVLFATLATSSLFLHIRELSQSELFVSFLYLLRWAFYVSLYFVVREQNVSFKHKLTIGMLLSGLAVVVLGFVQYFLYPDLRNLFYGGWDEHLYRLFSTFLDPNFAGAFLVIYIIFVAWLFTNNFFKTQWRRYGLVVTGIAASIALLLTYSRGSYLAFIVAAFLFLLLIKRIKLFLLLIALFGLGLFLLPKDLQSEGVKFFRTASIEARSDEMRNAVTIIKDNWVFGVGFNAYRFAKRDYGFLQEETWQEVHSGGGTDNSFLFVFATTGIFGLFSFIYLLYRMSTLGLVMACSVGALVVGSLFVNALFYPSILVWIFLLAGAAKRD